MQRRLSACDVDDICGSYVRGSSIDELARSFGVNRTTIIKHLDQRSVPRRRVVRKMTDILVAEAATMYLHGHSLKTVADAFKGRHQNLGPRVPQGWSRNQAAAGMDLLSHTMPRSHVRSRQQARTKPFVGRRTRSQIRRSGTPGTMSAARRGAARVQRNAQRSLVSA